ncbi:MAG: dienelactone hydrolase family protein [Chloroflexota bacterium]|nr:dienelactone hydrolase family protein [Chloroflexota bacterium]
MNEHPNDRLTATLGPGGRQGGAPLASAHAALVLLHGRGASAADIPGLAQEVDAPGTAYLAPQAPGSQWYPYSFLAPLASNEPWLGESLARIETLLELLGAAGIPAERVALLGFSQGACLALEYAARHARRFGAVVGLSGGLIGPDDTPRNYPGDFGATPIFLGCSDVDPHIPRARVDLTATALRRMGGAVDERIYPGMGHTINWDELAAVRELVAGIAR